MSKNWKGGLDQYNAERFDRHFWHSPKKSGTERVKAYVDDDSGVVSCTV